MASGSSGAPGAPPPSNKYAFVLKNRGVTALAKEVDALKLDSAPADSTPAAAAPPPQQPPPSPPSSSASSSDDERDGPSDAVKRRVKQAARERALRRERAATQELEQPGGSAASHGPASRAILREIDRRARGQYQTAEDGVGTESDDGRRRQAQYDDDVNRLAARLRQNAALREARRDAAPTPPNEQGH